MTRRWFTAAMFILVSGCASTGGIDLSKLPPIVISAPPSTPVENKPEPTKPMATVAFHVVDDATGAPIPIAIATFEDETAYQVKDDGYVAIEKELNTYQVKISASDYVTHIVDVILTGNRQFEVRLASSKPTPVPAGVDYDCYMASRHTTDVAQRYTECLAKKNPPAPAPPVVTPPPSVPDRTEVIDTKYWNDEQWRDAFFRILKKHNAPRTVNLQTLNDTRADVEALGAEWQHDSAGTLRPRLFLPVPFGADPYSRPFDVGLYGQPWEWVKR